jgi:hypothetical protein
VDGLLIVLALLYVPLNVLNTTYRASQPEGNTSSKQVSNEGRGDEDLYPPRWWQFSEKELDSIVWSVGCAVTAQISVSMTGLWRQTG